MSVITKAIFDVLNSDATLTALLGTFSGNAGIFTTDPPPSKAVLPYIVTAGDVSGLPFDAKNAFGRAVDRDIRCYSDATGTAKTVEDIANRVRVLFERQIIAITGFDTIIASTSGPTAVDEEDIYGRVVTVSLTIMETP